MAPPADLDFEQNERNMLAGELYYAFTPKLNEQRTKCARACSKFNHKAADLERREQLELLIDIIPSVGPLPARLPDQAADEAQLESFPVVLPPFTADYGLRVKIGQGSFLNGGTVILDTTQCTIGDRVLFGPDVALYSASHPIDPDVRRGLEGPELGKNITIEDDCWIGGRATICPGVTIGRGSTVAAGAVVTKVFLNARRRLGDLGADCLPLIGCRSLLARRRQSR
ncbi:trimeric LpxA-like protein, partial [Leucosporidium creatinivorum]